MKILLCITSLGVGGAERLVTGLADRYVERGHEVMLIRFHGELYLKPSDPRVRLENLNMPRSFLGVLIALVRYRRLVRSFQPNVVNSHLVHANILTRMLRLVTPMSCLISSAHNTNEEGRGRMLAYRLTDWLTEMSSNVSCEAVAAFERRGAIRPGRMITVHNGIDTEKFAFDPTARARVRTELGLDQDTILLLSVGRLAVEKDYPNLLRAFSYLQDEGYPLHLGIVGDGPLRAELESMVSALAMRDRVHFFGVRHDVPALMSASDIFVLSSAWEGFGLVVAEAMACERPVVATDSGGVREVVGEAGSMVPPGDSVSLAIALETTLRLSTDQRQKVGQAARSRVLKHFSLDAAADRYLAMYQGGLEGHS